MGHQRGSSRQELPKVLLKDLKRAKRRMAMCLALPIRSGFGNYIPWGYVDGNQVGKPDILIPSMPMYDKLYEGTQMLKEHSFRSVADWVSDSTGVHLGKSTLFEIVRDRPPWPEYKLPMDEKLELYREFDPYKY